MLAALAMFVPELGGCHSDTTGVQESSTTSTVRQFWRLALDQHAITMALLPPYNHLRLKAIPLSAHDDTLGVETPVVFTSSDSGVLVDSTGMLTAHSIATNVAIVARLTIADSQGHRLSLVDTAIVNVNDVATVPRVAKILIETPGDSAKCSLNPAYMLVDFVAQDMDQRAIPEAQIRLTSADPTVTNFGVSGGVLIEHDFGYQGDTTLETNATCAKVGTTQLFAEATIYGVRLKDSLRVTVGHSLVATIPVNTVTTYSQGLASHTIQFSSGSTMTIGVGGIADFQNETRDTVDVVFDNASLVGGATLDRPTLYFLYGIFCLPKTYGCPTPALGNILLPPSDSLGLFPNGTGRAFRLFSQAGVYLYHSDRFSGAIGKIIVQ